MVIARNIFLDDDLFLPSKQRAVDLNISMHKALLKSLEHIKEQIKLSGSTSFLALDSVILSLKRGLFLSPETFGWYYSIVFDFLNKQDKSAFDKLSKLQEASLFPSDKLEVVDYNYYYVQENISMYKNSLGESDGFGFTAPNKESFIAFEAMLQASLNIIKSAIPLLYDEINILVKKIIIVSPGKSCSHFHGAAVYQLWRLLFLNVDAGNSLLKMIETIIHESAHVYLFGFSINEPLTLNNVDELYYSSIRQADRPMDGIYHATFVTARICWAMTKILKQSVFPGEIQKDIEIAIQKNLSHFKKGYETIQNHGKLSENGKNILDHSWYNISNL